MRGPKLETLNPWALNCRCAAVWWSEVAKIRGLEIWGWGFWSSSPRGLEAQIRQPWYRNLAEIRFTSKKRQSWLRFIRTERPKRLSDFPALLPRRCSRDRQTAIKTRQREKTRRYTRTEQTKNIRGGSTAGARAPEKHRCTVAGARSATCERFEESSCAVFVARTRPAFQVLT